MSLPVLSTARWRALQSYPAGLASDRPEVSGSSVREGEVKRSAYKKANPALTARLEMWSRSFADRGDGRWAAT